MSHTKGKLVAEDRFISESDGTPVANTAHYDNSVTNAHRLVFCWNEHDDLVKDRDELVEALRSLVDWFHSETNSRTLFEIMKAAKAVLAKYPKEES